MTTQPLIKTLFEHDITRRIEEVIKVDQTDDQSLKLEMEEYVVTDAIRGHYTGIYEAYRETPNKPHEGIAIWVSGFFGSGKSSFAKMLGLTIENRPIAGESASERFAARAGDNKLHVLLKAITETIPTHAVIFDVSTDRGIRSGNQTLTEIMYGLFLQSLGYAKDLDLSELEIGLEEHGRLGRFEEEYKTLFKKDWKTEKGKVAFALSEASRVLHSLEPATYPMADSWVKAVKNKADITPGKLADRANLLMKRRQPGKNLMFVVDEVGQFVARDVQKMLDLQAIVQSLGVKGRGKHWLVVTSQEKLGELVNGLDGQRTELARLMDRFPLQVHLEPSDISEVTSRRVLSKNAPGQAALGKLFDEHHGRLIEHTRLTAEIRLPTLERTSFIDLYPLLPYQIDLIIQVVSGLRTQGGMSKHVGGANRTIIKLAQQLLVHENVNLAGQPLGALVRMDQVYDLVEGNIGSEVRGKISAISKELSHPLAQAVAKVICLLQYVKSVHRSPENIAAALHPGVAADSQLASVQEALRELELTHKVRRGDDGYRIPTPAEDDWERQRNGISPKPGDAHRIYSEVLAGFWQPQPSHTLFETKTFKAGLAIHGRDVTDGDLMFQVYFSEEGKELQERTSELRARSQQERKNVFWSVGLNAAIDREMVELFRSREILARKERETKGEDTPGLIAEERVRQRRHAEELRRLLKASCLSGNVYFRGNDRSPGDRAVDVGKSAAEILGQVLPDVFERFKEAAAKSTDVKKGVEALFSAENLQGLPSVFRALALLRDEKGKSVFQLETGPLREVSDRILERANYGDTASGRFLAEELAKEPFGWDFDVVRLFVLALLRAGKLEGTSRGQTFDSTTDSEARETFSNNNYFRQSSFRPKSGGCEYETVLVGSEHCRDVFGVECKDIQETIVARVIRENLSKEEPRLLEMLVMLRTRGLSGTEVLQSAYDLVRSLKNRSDCPTIQEFSASYRSLKDSIKRARELEHHLTEPRLHDLERARQALVVAWPVLVEEPDLSLDVTSHADALRDLLARETFFRDIPAIEQHARVLETEYARRFDDAQQARIEAHQRALVRLSKLSGWAELSEDTQRDIAAPLVAGTRPALKTATIALLRSEREACESRLRIAIRRVQETLEGERLASVPVQAYFGRGIETEEQLDAALAGLREECARLIGAGKKVVLS
jgi:hypothetical protein